MSFMTPEQREFFRELLRPFRKDELKTKNVGGQPLTYLRGPALLNRLDDVCGPTGWTIEYRETNRGYTARLGILCPQRDGSWAWQWKEDGGGEETMTKKSGGEMVEDEDNSDKSAYTNALRRVGMAWGFARELWQCGVPSWRADLGLSGTPGAKAPPPKAEPAPTTARPAPAGTSVSGPSKAAPAGDSLVRWLRETTEVHAIDLRPKVKALIESEGLPGKVSDWTAEQVARWHPDLRAAAEKILQARAEKAPNRAAEQVKDDLLHMMFPPAEEKPGTPAEEGANPFAEAPAAATQAPTPAGATDSPFTQVSAIRQLCNDITRSLWPVTKKRHKKTGELVEDATSFTAFYAKTLQVVKLLLPATMRDWKQLELITDGHMLNSIEKLCQNMLKDLNENPEVYAPLKRQVA